MKPAKVQILLWILLACWAIQATGHQGPGQRIADATFTVLEREIIREHFATHGGPPPGRARGLPPGIAKNLARGKPLPPGIAKQQLPPELRTKLPPPPEGFERIYIDGRVFLVEAATQVVHDILTDLVR